MGYKAIGFLAIILTAAHLAEAQQAKKVPRIGVLHAGSSSSAETRSRFEAFQQGLRDFGYVDAQNVVIEYRWTEGSNERLPGLAAELVQLKVDLIVVTGGSPVVLATKNATSAIPIVFVGSLDPVGIGLVASLAQPGGNITGLTTGAPGLYGKRLELVKETIPRLSLVGLLFNPTNPAAAPILKETQAAAKGLGVQVQSLEMQSPSDIATAFEGATKKQVGALIVTQQPPISTNPKRIVELSAKSRLPAIYQDTGWPAAGGLMSYGPIISELYRHVATYVDKILKGATPANLPVEQPTKFEFTINLKTAKQIGLTIPQSVLFQADKVIK